MSLVPLNIVVAGRQCYGSYLTQQALFAQHHRGFPTDLESADWSHSDKPQDRVLGSLHMLLVEIRKFRWDLWPVKPQVDARKVTWRGYVASNGDFTRSVTSPTRGRHTLPLAAAAEDSEPSDLPGLVTLCTCRSFAATLQRWVEFVRHEDRREDHTMFGVLREGGRERTDDSTCCTHQLLQLGPRQGRQRRRADRVRGDKRPGDEMLQ